MPGARPGRRPTRAPAGSRVGQTAAVTVLTWIAALSLLSWLWLALGQGFFWRTDVRLPERRPPERWPEVAVVVPARDEAEVLPVSLASVLRRCRAGCGDQPLGALPRDRLRGPRPGPGAAGAALRGRRGGTGAAAAAGGRA